MNTRQTAEVLQREKFICIPSFRNGFFFPLRIQLPLPRLRALYKRTLLGMKLTKHATRLPLIDHTTTLPPPASIAWSVLPTSNVGARLCRRRAAHACRELSSAVAVDAWGLDGGLQTGLSSSYSNGLRPSNRSWGRHGVMRLDWVADPHQVPEFCAAPVTSFDIGGWLRR